MTNECPISKNPIFIFSAGMRTGSTLLQRLITSSEQALIWGESGNGLNCLASSYHNYLDKLLSPNQDGYIENVRGGHGHEQYENFRKDKNSGVHLFIANINPPPDDIKNTFLFFFESMYAKSAEHLGYKRWGVKDVYSGAKTAIFLRGLYPQAKFVFLVRHPHDTLLSLKRHDWMGSFNDPFLHHALIWKRLSSEFRTLDFGLIVRYEDLISNNNVINKLRDYLELPGIPLDFIELSRADVRPANIKKLSLIERIKLFLLIRKEMAHHGYKYKMLIKSVESL